MSCSKFNLFNYLFIPFFMALILFGCGEKDENDDSQIIETVSNTPDKNPTDTNQIISDTTNKDTLIVKSNPAIDGDGNVYDTVRIGNQTWFASNLYTKSLIDKSEISLDYSYEAHLKETPIYQDPAEIKYAKNPKEYGYHYNFHTIETEKLCPQGWHVSTKDDWSVLLEYVSKNVEYSGNSQEQGIALFIRDEKTYYKNPVGFSGLPGGYTLFSKCCGSGGNPPGSASYYWWTSDQLGLDGGYYIQSFGTTISIATDALKGSFMPVRCVKD